MSTATLIEISDSDGVLELAQHVRDPARDEPVVALTSRPGERGPALDPGEIRVIVGPAVPINFVSTGSLTRALTEALPEKLDVYGGAARIWWPGAGDSSDPRDHPLVLDPYGVYGTQAIEDFRRKFVRGEPAERVVEDPKMALLERERDEARAEVALRRANEARLATELDDFKARASQAERALREHRRTARVQRAERAVGWEEIPDDPEAAFMLLVYREWLELPRADRMANPIQAFSIGAKFIERLDACELVNADRVARVCSRIACGRTEGLDAHRLRTGRGGDDPQVIRSSDRAEAWRCYVKRNSPAAPRLHWWRLANGSIEFASVGGHDEIEIPE